MGRAADNELTQYHGNAHHQDTADIHQDEGPAAVHASLVWETPYVTQSHRRAHCRSNGTHACRKSYTFCHSMLIHLD